MKKLVFLIVFLILPLSAGAQKYALKNNILGDVVAIPNLSFEFRIAPKWTIDLSATYNPFVWSGGNGLKTQWSGAEMVEAGGWMLKHWVGQPEVRYWTCEAFNGLFFGVHGMFGQHNITGVKMPPISFGGGDDGAGTLKADVRYQGNFWGLGASVGHQWILSDRWNIEASIGLGYVSMKHNEIDPKDHCNVYTEAPVNFSMIWLTKATLSIVYIIK